MRIITLDHWLDEQLVHRYEIEAAGRLQIEDAALEHVTPLAFNPPARAPGRHADRVRPTSDHPTQR